MNNEINIFNENQLGEEKSMCKRLSSILFEQLPDGESKIWHGHPVWFLNDNPIVGYSKLKAGIRLMFWSGASFGEDKLTVGTGKFKDASIVYTRIDEIDEGEISKWVKKARNIQWDYKNVAKRKGKLIRIK